MSSVGTAIGGLLTVASIFLAGIVTMFFTNSYFWLGLFWIFGILGGIALGNLNSRKARTRNTYRQEYLAYASIFLGAIIILGVFYLFFLTDRVASALVQDAPSAGVVVWLAITSGLSSFVGVGLVLANIVAPESSY